MTTIIKNALAKKSIQNQKIFLFLLFKIYNMFIKYNSLKAKLFLIQ